MIMTTWFWPAVAASVFIFVLVALDLWARSQNEDHAKIVMAFLVGLECWLFYGIISELINLGLANFFQGS